MPLKLTLRLTSSGTVGAGVTVTVKTAVSVVLDPRLGMIEATGGTSGAIVTTIGVAVRVAWL